MQTYFRIGEVGRLAERDEKLVLNYDLIYGAGNWRIVEHSGGAFLEAMNISADLRKKLDADLIIVTGNPGKVASAKRNLGDLIKMENIKLEISEDFKEVEDIARYKASVAHSVLCRPVLCDDSGFVIPSVSSIGDWPGSRVDRELKKIGIQGFLDIAKNGPVYSYWIQVLSYMDCRLTFPVLFSAKIEGHLIGEEKGHDKPDQKSVLWKCFCLKGQNKTLAEMSDEELRKRTKSESWTNFKKFYESWMKKS